MLFNEAKKYIPGGVNSPVRAFGLVEGDPLFINRASGSLLYDEDGDAYIDYVGSWGPMIFGHSHPKIQNAIAEKLPFSTSFGAPTKDETTLAQKIVRMLPDVDKVRLVNSGTEATMTALRLARGFTGRDLVLKFEGCYHGHSDAFLVKAGSGATTGGNPSSAGVPDAVIQNTILAKFNDLSQVASLFLKHGYHIAAVIVEPVAGNMGCIPPKDNFLKGLRFLCDQFGTVLIFDEVMTGFRLAKGGASEHFRVKADLLCYGKIIGGGLPVGAVAGKSRIMDHLAPDGPVYQAGTLSGNPLAVAAGNAQLSMLEEDQELYERLEEKGKVLEKAFNDLKMQGFPIWVNRVGSMISVFFTGAEVKNYDDALNSDIGLFRQFFHEMLKNKVYIPPSPFETWFISDTTSSEMLTETIELINETIKKVYASQLIES